MIGDKLIGLVENNNITLIKASNSFKTIKIKNMHRWSLSEEDRLAVSTLNKLKNKTIDLVLNYESSLSRLVTLPKMNKKLIQKYLDENITDYFSINKYEYHYDYSVIRTQQLKNKSSSENGNKDNIGVTSQAMQVLVVAVLKTKINTLKNYVRDKGLKVGKITVYSENILNLYTNKYNKEKAIIKISQDKGNVTIINKEGMFIDAHINIEDTSNNNIVESINYFLEFYRRSNQGKSINSITFIGDYIPSEIIKSIESTHNIDNIKTNLESLDIRYNSKKYMVQLYPEIISLLIKRGKCEIDFNKKRFIEKSSKKLNMTGLLRNTYILTIILFITYIIVSNNNIKDTSKKIKNMENQLTSLQPILKEYNIINNKINKVNKRIELLESIKPETYSNYKNSKNYYEYTIDIINDMIKDRAQIERISLSEDLVDLDLIVNNKTLDNVELVEHINSYKVFMVYNIEEISLNNDITTLNIKLTYNNNNGEESRLK